MIIFASIFEDFMENKRKITIAIDERVFESIKEYCSLNGITISLFANEALLSHLIMEKYGDTPFADYSIPETPTVQEEDVTEKEVQKEPEKEITRTNIEAKKPKKIVLK